MFRHLAVRAFVVVAVLATGGVAVAAVYGTDPVAAPAAVSATAAPVVQFPPQSSPTSALVSACAGRTVKASLINTDADRVDELLAERSLHTAALAGNPLSSGAGFQAGVDDVLHIQAIDQQLAQLLCPAR
jgi:hypothetical protein